MTDPTPPPTAAVTSGPTSFKDDDLVYVDPDTKAVVGMVEWGKTGNPKSRVTDNVETEDGRRRYRKFYPFGTYRAMKRAFHLEGKHKRVDSNAKLDDVIEKALAQAFWD